MPTASPHFIDIHQRAQLYVTDHAALFAPRDYISETFAVGRLSVTFVYCIQTAEDIVKLLPRPDNPIILVFDSMRRHQIPTRQIHREWEKFEIFD